MKFLEDGTKVRVSKLSGNIIPKSDILKQRKNPTPSNSTKDTSPSMVTKQTFSFEHDIVHKKNNILKKLELEHYNHLKQLFQRNGKQEKYKKLKQMKFEFEVFKRAKELLLIEREKELSISSLNEQLEEVEGRGGRQISQGDEEEEMITKKISNQIQDMKLQMKK